MPEYNDCAGAFSRTWVTFGLGPFWALDRSKRVQVKLNNLYLNI